MPVKRFVSYVHAHNEIDAETWEEAEASYWDHIRAALVEQGVATDAAGLRSLPHDVVPR